MRLSERIQQLKIETYALYLAYRDPRTPWYARAWAAVVIAYAFSPIDLIPDFIPVVGYLDDLILVPLGIWLAIRLIPAEVMTDARSQAITDHDQPRSRAGVVIVVIIWLLLAAGGIALVRQVVAG